MTIIDWFFLFIAIFGVICGYAGFAAKEKVKEENKYLRNALKIQSNRAEYFKRKSEHSAVFDFEKEG